MSNFIICEKCMKNLAKFFAILGILLGPAILGGAWASINMSLASIQENLGASLLKLEWVMNIYGIAVCITLLPIGKLGDSYGRKLLYVAGVLGLLLSCLTAGLSHSIEYVIASMALFGVSGAAIMVLSQALIVHEYPEEEKPKALALWGTSVSISLSLGPLLGGVIIKYLSWRWVFLINILPLAIAAAFVLLFVKQRKSHSSTCNWGAVILIAFLIGGTITGILQGPVWGWNSIGIIALFGMAALSLLALIVLERKSSNPLFHPSLFANRGFLLASICNGCLLGFIWAIFFFVPLYLQNQRAFTPLETGFNMLLITLPVIFFSLPVSKLYTKVGSRTLLFAGFSLLLLSALLQPKLPITVFCLSIGFGWVLTWGPSIMKALSSLPHRMAGMASGMFITLQEIGGVLGLAIAGVTFRIGMKSYLSPQMDRIREVLGDQTDRFLADPTDASRLVEPNSPLLTWLKEGFSIGFGNVLFFLVVLMAFALFGTAFIPKFLGKK
jgi:MFS family permease